MSVNATVWQNDELAGKFLSGVRGAIPFAAEHMRIMLDVLIAHRDGTR